MVEHRKQTSMKMFGMVSEKERAQYLNILMNINEKMQERG
jgi:hypothetical protein